MHIFRDGKPVPYGILDFYAILKNIKNSEFRIPNSEFKKVVAVMCGGSGNEPLSPFTL